MSHSDLPVCQRVPVHRSVSSCLKLAAALGMLTRLLLLSALLTGLAGSRGSVCVCDVQELIHPLDSSRLHKPLVQQIYHAAEGLHMDQVTCNTVLRLRCGASI